MTANDGKGQPEEESDGEEEVEPYEIMRPRTIPRRVLVGGVIMEKWLPPPKPALKEDEGIGT